MDMNFGNNYTAVHDDPQPNKYYVPEPRIRVYTAL
jgi:hypothetical protein